MRAAYPFSAIVAQEEMKLALQMAAVDASIGGVLVFGDRGTGKSTTVRALAALLPKMRAVVDCRYDCDPEAETPCEDCRRRYERNVFRMLDWARPSIASSARWTWSAR